MTDEERAEELIALRAKLRSDSFRTSMEERRNILSEIVSLLNYNPVLHSHAVTAADILSQPHFSNNLYERLEGRIDLIVGEAIAELEKGLTQPKSPRQDRFKLTDEHGAWWFVMNCTTKTRAMIISAVLAILTAGYLAGRNHFINQVIELWKQIQSP